MPFDLEPLGDRVVIKRLDDDAEMLHGLHIPEIAQVKSSKGLIMAVGEGRYLGGKIEPLPLAEGDIVLFSKYGGTECSLDGEEYIVLRFDELLLRHRRVTLASTSPIEFHGVTQ